MLNTARSYLHSSGHNTGTWRTDGQTDGRTDRIPLASTALCIAGNADGLKNGSFFYIYNNNNRSYSVRNSLSIWYRHSTMQYTTIFKTFTYESENGLWCDGHLMLIFECRHVHPRGPREHLPECLPAYALAYQYVTLDTRRKKVVLVLSQRCAGCGWIYLWTWIRQHFKDAWTV